MGGGASGETASFVAGWGGGGRCVGGSFARSSHALTVSPGNTVLLYCQVYSSLCVCPMRNSGFRVLVLSEPLFHPCIIPSMPLAPMMAQHQHNARSIYTILVCFHPCFTFNQSVTFVYVYAEYFSKYNYFFSIHYFLIIPSFHHKDFFLKTLLSDTPTKNNVPLKTHKN